jgi:hypothetical protein
VAERLHLAIKPVSRRPGFEADMQQAVPGRESVDRPLDRQRTVLDVSKKPDCSLPPPSAIATACFFLATSKATKTSLCFPMVRPPCMRLRSVRPSNPRSYLHERAGHRREPANMTSRATPSIARTPGLKSSGLRRLAPPRNPDACCAAPVGSFDRRTWSWTLNAFRKDEAPYAQPRG